MRTSVLALAFSFCLCAQGLPPRTAPTEDQVVGKAGDVTLAADFLRHSVPPGQGARSTEEYVGVGLGMSGPPEAKTTISLDDFSLRINGKKTILKAQPYG